ncbi:RDD family protein [Cerasibacillus sp. JNUCC 74]
MSELTAENAMMEITSDTYRYAGFWMRFWAYIMDLIVVASINGILLTPFKFINDGEVIEMGFWTLTGIIASITFYLYFLLMTKKFGQTLGKMIMGIKVIREDGEKLTWNDLLFREVIGRFIHRVFSFLAVLYIVVAFTKEKQGIHDMIGNTRVVFVD